MAKRGAPKHMKRMAVPTAVPIHDKKAHTWMIRTMAGPHQTKYSMPLAVLLRDVLKLARTSKESKQLLAGRMVEVDGKVRVEEKFPVGLMDTVSFPQSGKCYRMVVDRKGRLFPMEIAKSDSSKKLVKIVKKHTAPGSKLNITFHDGRNLLADNHLRVGDTVELSLPEAKLKSHLKRDLGARCLIMKGKHVGTLVKLKQIINRAGGKPPEAMVEDESGNEFITVAGYLFVVDNDFKIEGEAQ